MNQMYARLIELGYAKAQVFDENADAVPMLFTNKGVRLRDDIRKIFGRPKRALMDIHPDEMCALCMLMVSFEPS